MTDEDLTGPSRAGWQLIWLLVLVALLVGFAVIPYLEARGEPHADATIIKWSDLPPPPPGYSGPPAKVEIEP